MAGSNIEVVPALIMAVSGAAIGWGGLKLSRRGQRDDAQQSEAAHKLAERVQNSHELEAINDRLVALVSKLEEQLDRAESALAEERTENDRRAHEQANRCRVALATALEHVHTLQSILHSEMAPVIEATANAEADAHDNEDHPDRRDHP